MSSDGEGRLARWAQRKAAVKQRRGGAAPTIPEEPAGVPAARAEPSDSAQSGAQETGRPVSELDLPEIESLTADSDFTAFMTDGVPAELRRLALRKLWASDPMFNVIDEMVEYGEDYTNAATVVAGMKSAWEAGRGYADKMTSKKGADAAATPDDGLEPDADSLAVEGKTVSDVDARKNETRERG